MPEQKRYNMLEYLRSQRSDTDKLPRTLSLRLYGDLRYKTAYIEAFYKGKSFHIKTFGYEEIILNKDTEALLYARGLREIRVEREGLPDFIHKLLPPELRAKNTQTT